MQKYIPWRHDGRNRNTNKNNQQPNKLFNAFCGGLLLFALGSWGLGAIGDAITSIGDGVSQAKEITETVKEIKSNTNANNSTNNSKQTKAKYDSYINYEIEISAEDVRDILENLEIGGDDDVNYTETETIVINYSAFNSEADYRKAIVDRLHQFQNPITFVATNPKELEYEDNVEEYNRVISLIQSVPIHNSYFSNIEMGGMPSCYEENKLTVALTFQ